MSIYVEALKAENAWQHPSCMYVHGVIDFKINSYKQSDCIVTHININTTEGNVLINLFTNDEVKNEPVSK
jgi:hypothetical protein